MKIDNYRKCCIDELHNFDVAGPAVSVVFVWLGKLWAQNDRYEPGHTEYMNEIQFCPFCGKQHQLEDSLEDCE